MDGSFITLFSFLIIINISRHTFSKAVLHDIIFVFIFSLLHVVPWSVFRLEILLRRKVFFLRLETRLRFCRIRIFSAIFKWPHIHIHVRFMKTTNMTMTISKCFPGFRTRGIININWRENFNYVLRNNKHLWRHFISLLIDLSSPSETFFTIN